MGQRRIRTTMHLQNARSMRKTSQADDLAVYNEGEYDSSKTVVAPWFAALPFHFLDQGRQSDCHEELANRENVGGSIVK